MIPFVYLIGWTKLNIWYCGVRYKKNCRPSDLWTKYFTSSKHVKQFRLENGEPDHIEILKEFDNPENAYNYEQEKLKEYDVLNKSNWLNKRVGYKFKYEALSKEHKRKISLANIGKHNRICSEETKQKIREKLQGRPRVPHSEEAKRKMAESARKRILSKEVREKISKTLSGRKQPEEVIQKRVEKLKGQIRKPYKKRGQNEK